MTGISLSFNTWWYLAIPQCYRIFGAAYFSTVWLYLYRYNYTCLTVILGWCCIRVQNSGRSRGGLHFWPKRKFSDISKYFSAILKLNMNLSAFTAVPSEPLSLDLQIVKYVLPVHLLFGSSTRIFSKKVLVETNATILYSPLYKVNVLSIKRCSHNSANPISSMVIILTVFVDVLWSCRCCIYQLFNQLFTTSTNTLNNVGYLNMLFIN